MKKPSRTNASALNRRENRCAYLFILPFVIGFAVLYLDMLVSSVVYSFSELTFNGATFRTSWIGIGNYKEILTKNPEYVPALTAAFTDMITMIPVVLIFSLFVAVLLNRKLPGRAAFRAIFFIPVILMTGIVAKTDTSALVQSAMPSEGIGVGASTGTTLDLSNVEAVLRDLSIGSGAVEFLVKFIDDIYSVVNHSGVQIILTLAALQSISPSVYEAASIEGATAWESFWKITLPMVAPTVFVCTIYTAIDLMSASTNRVMLLIESTSETSGYGPSAAMAWLFFLLIAVVLGVISLFGKKVLEQ